MPTMDKETLLAATNLPPEEAIRYFEALGYKITWGWEAGADAVANQAFTVAKVARMDVLQDIKDEIGKALKEGKTFETFRQELSPTLAKKGWLGRVVKDAAGVEKVEAPWRLQTIYRTNMQSAYMQGREEAFNENIGARPIWEYVAVLDGSTRPEHAALHGVRLPASDPFWTTHRPSLGFNCRCRFRALTPSKAASRGGITPKSAIPDVKPDKGFEKKTKIGDFKPDTRKYSPDIKAMGKRIEADRD